MNCSISITTPTTITNGGAVQTGLLIADLVLTAVVTIMTSIRFRAKCGRFEFSFKPKNAPQSPGSAMISEQGSPAQQTNPAAETELREVEVVPGDAAAATDESPPAQESLTGHSPIVKPLIKNAEGVGNDAPQKKQQ